MSAAALVGALIFAVAAVGALFGFVNLALSAPRTGETVAAVGGSVAVLAMIGALAWSFARGAGLVP